MRGSSAAAGIQGASAGSWQDWEPGIKASTDPTYGTGAIRDGKWCRVGNLVIANFWIRFGTSASYGTGNWYLPIPIPADPDVYRTDKYYAQLGVGVGYHVIGQGLSYDPTVQATYGMTAYLRDVESFYPASVGGTGTANGAYKSTHPVSWGDNAWFSGQLTYAAVGY